MGAENPNATFFARPADVGDDDLDEGAVAVGGDHDLGRSWAIAHRTVSRLTATCF